MIKTITVTQEHINNGTHMPSSCPVALAIKEICPSSNPLVYGINIIFEVSVLSLSQIRISAPASAAEWIWDYDHPYFLTSPLSPFSFDLDIPEGVPCD